MKVYVLTEEDLYNWVIKEKIIILLYLEVTTLNIFDVAF